jgi:hypothetical protein
MNQQHFKKDFILSGTLCKYCIFFHSQCSDTLEGTSYRNIGGNHYHRHKGILIFFLMKWNSGPNSCHILQVVTEVPMLKPRPEILQIECFCLFSQEKDMNVKTNLIQSDVLNK